MHREQRRAKPDKQAKKHKEQLAALVEEQRKVETLGYLDSGGEMTEPDQGGYEEATDMLGMSVCLYVSDWAFACLSLSYPWVTGE